MAKPLFQQFIDLSLEEYEMFLHLPWQTRLKAVVSIALFYLSLVILIYLTLNPFLAGIFSEKFVGAVYVVMFLLMISDNVLVFYPQLKKYYGRFILVIFALSAVIGGVIGATAKAENTLPEAKMLVLFGAGFIAIIAGTKLYGRVARTVFTEKTRIETEIKLAQKIQAQLLPAITLDLPTCQIFGKTTPAQEVGGDYFEVVELPAQRLAVAVGDVSGHNVAAGLLMAITKSAFLTELKYLSSLEKLVSSINQTLVKNSDKGMFVSFLCGLFDFQKQAVTLANAGHMPLLHYQSRTQQIIEQTTPGMALGLTSEASFNVKEISFEKGDCFLFFTDGMVEATNAAGEEFGISRLAQEARRLAPTASARQLYDGILAELQRFSVSTKNKDDVTMLVLNIV